MHAHEQEVKAIVRSFAFLQSMDFEVLPAEPDETPLLGSGVVVIYKHSGSGNAVKISYHSGSGGRPSSASVLICNNSGDRFWVEDWLAAKGVNEDITFSSEGRGDAFIPELGRRLAPILTGRLRRTLIGEEWDRVDFDWKGYR